MEGATSAQDEMTAEIVDRERIHREDATARMSSQHHMMPAAGMTAMGVLTLHHRQLSLPQTSGSQ